eukprot:3075411-Pleurochrysis_carterae.AAC.1
MVQQINRRKHVWAPATLGSVKEATRAHCSACAKESLERTIWPQSRVSFNNWSNALVPEYPCRSDQVAARIAQLRNLVVNTRAGEQSELVLCRATVALKAIARGQSCAYARKKKKEPCKYGDQSEPGPLSSSCMINSVTRNTGESSRTSCGIHLHSLLPISHARMHAGPGSIISGEPLDMGARAKAPLTPSERLPQSSKARCTYAPRLRSHAARAADSGDAERGGVDAMPVRQAWAYSDDL